MLTEKPTPEQIKEWKNIYEQYKDKIKPNKKTGREVIEYLLSHYSLTPANDDRIKQVISLNVLSNEYMKKKLPAGMAPDPVAYYLNDKEKQTLIGIDLTTGYYLVEGSPALYDEICAFQGLDEQDIKNYACVAQYVNCLKNIKSS